MLLFALVAIAELATFIAVEAQIGLPATLAIAIATAVIGSMLVRRAGASVWRDLQRRIASGGVPTRELSHGASILVAGALLISPGLITDTVGFLLLIPAVRDRVHAAVSKRVQQRVTVVSSGFRTDVIDVEGWEVTEEPRPGRLP